MGGGLENRCVGRVYGTVGAVGLVLSSYFMKKMHGQTTLKNITTQFMSSVNSCMFRHKVPSSGCLIRTQHHKSKCASGTSRPCEDLLLLNTLRTAPCAETCRS